METFKVALVIAVAPWVSAIAIRRARQLWRNETSGHVDAFPQWFRRAFPSLALWLPLCSCLGAAAIALNHFNGESSVGQTMTAVGACAWVIGMPLTVSVALSGRPAVLVPPALRRRSHSKRAYDGPSLESVGRVVMLWVAAFAATLLVMQWVG